MARRVIIMQAPRPGRAGTCPSDQVALPLSGGAMPGSRFKVSVFPPPVQGHQRWLVKSIAVRVWRGRKSGFPRTESVPSCVLVRPGHGGLGGRLVASACQVCGGGFASAWYQQRPPFGHGIGNVAICRPMVALPNECLIREDGLALREHRAGLSLPLNRI